MHLVHKIYKHEVTHPESVTEKTPIVQRSYELIHQMEKKDYSGRCKCKYWTILSKILEDGVHIKYPILIDYKPQILPSAHIFLPTGYTRNHGDLQITSIRDAGSYRTAKCDIGPYLGRVRCFRFDVNTFNRLIGLIRAFDRVNLA